MLKRYGATATLTLALYGCASTPPGHSHPWMLYTCTDGQAVQAAYPDTDTAVIKLNGHTHTLHIAISGSGARYTGEAWQWWTKGMHDALLAPLAAGESIARAPGVACHAD